MKGEVLTAWTGDGLSLESSNRPVIADDYTVAWTDTTGQPSENLTPNPNMYIVQIECDEATLEAIEADSKYEILWSED